MPLLSIWICERLSTRGLNALSFMRSKIAIKQKDEIKTNFHIFVSCLSTKNNIISIKDISSKIFFLAGYFWHFSQRGWSVWFVLLPFKARKSTRTTLSLGLCSYFTPSQSLFFSQDLLSHYEPKLLKSSNTTTHSNRLNKNLKKAWFRNLDPKKAIFLLL